MSICLHCRGTGKAPMFTVGMRVTLIPEYEDDGRQRTGVIVVAGNRKIVVARAGEASAEEWSAYWWQPE